MFDFLAEVFSYKFIARAVIVGSLVSLCAALLGVSLVLKRYANLGQGIANIGFGATAFAMAFGLLPLRFSLVVVVLATFLLLRLFNAKKSKIKGDSAVALFSTAAIAIGVVAVSLTIGLTLDICNFMFGSILVMSRADVFLSIGLSVVVIALYLFFYNQIFAVTFDEEFARAAGLNTRLYNTLIALFTAITVALGMRLMGSMLISGIIIFPALAAMQVCTRFKTTLAVAAGVSVVAFFLGIVGSYIWGVPTGAAIVCANLAFFLVFALAGFIKRRAVKA